jgi:hypothetical protein
MQTSRYPLPLLPEWMRERMRAEVDRLGLKPWDMTPTMAHYYRASSADRHQYERWQRAMQLHDQIRAQDHHYFDEPTDSKEQS